MNGIKVIWYDGNKPSERPRALLINGETLEVKKWIPVGIVRNFLGKEREVHKVYLEDGSCYRIEYERERDECVVERLRNL
jgi:hypothetical protein